MNPPSFLRRVLPGVVALPAATLLGWPGVALAGGGGGKGDLEQTLGAASLLVLVALAYLLAHLVLARLERRFLFVSGFEYLLLGCLIAVARMMGTGLPGDPVQVLPIVALAAGWFGLLSGFHTKRSEFATEPTGTFSIALLDMIFAGLSTGTISYFLARWAGGGEHALVIGGTIGCFAATGGTSPIDVVKQRYKVQGKLVPVIRRAAELSDVLALAMLGFFLIPEGATALPTTGTPLWLGALGLLLGAGLGLFFVPFLGRDPSPNSQFLALVGIITFGSGAAYLLDISPLPVNLALGAVFINVSRAGRQLRSTLEQTERPMSLVLYVFAGALWLPPHSAGEWLATLAAATAVIFFRWIGKVAGAFASTVAGQGRADLYRGLLGQGHVAIAMAVSFRLLYSGTFATNAAYTAMLASVVFYDFLAPRTLRVLLADAHQIRKEQEA
ncbi:MAG: hypothetical protein KC416_00350 [Myxococcales bacterium]|nr:hypothetical protein [Myxococcales bacterium]